jgi:hypothetical protein
MSAINVLTFPRIFVIPQACCDCVRDHAETHIPVTRTPIVTARWALVCQPAEGRPVTVH